MSASEPRPTNNEPGGAWSYDREIERLSPRPMTQSNDTPRPRNVVGRYLAARRERECPKCHGKGSDVLDTILRHNFRKRPCDLCGGEGTVRYARSIALGVALRGRIDHEDDPTVERIVR